MKNFDVKELGLEELCQSESRKINGGWIWIPIAFAIMFYGSGGGTY
jgi:hypothetical protein